MEEPSDTESWPGLLPLAGGWSGETFLSEVDGVRAVVRIYGDGRPDHAPEVDAAVLVLVRGLLPVAEVLEVRRRDTTTGSPGLLVTSWLPGERGDLVLPTLDRAGRERLGANLGVLAGQLAGMPMLRAGAFASPDLAIAPWPAGADGLEAWVEDRADAFAHWSARERSGLGDVAGRAQALLDTVGRACLVHSDLNPKNVLVDPGSLEVTGLVDWEYAHAGHPFTDLGNLVRLDRSPEYVDAAVAAYSSLRGGEPAHLLDLARAADLWALVDLASRARDNPVAARAEELLRAVAGDGDLHAWPRTP